MKISFFRTKNGSLLSISALLAVFTYVFFYVLNKVRAKNKALTASKNLNNLIEIAQKSKVNIPIRDLKNAQIVKHDLFTTKIDVDFFDESGREIHNMDFEVIDDSSFRVFLPELDDEIANFTGDIFVTNRL